MTTKLDLLATGYPSLDYICQVSHTPAIGETAIVRTPPSPAMITSLTCSARG